MAALKQELAETRRELQTQMTRIAQMQAQLDRLTGGPTPEPRDRRSATRVEH